MDINSHPQNEPELEHWMKENCYHFNSYSINGNAIYEGYGIERTGGLFIWYYTERGKQNTLKYFNTEKEIVEYAFGQIKSDKWARNHCVGFTTEKNESAELGDELNNLGIEFEQDEIPYYGLQRPVYRTFVWGCDIKKVAHLKEKYYREK